LPANQPHTHEHPASPWRHALHEIIFEADTPSGKAFDVILIISIVLSVFAVMLDSVEWFNTRYAGPLHIAEWCFTVLFTIEYVLRLLSVSRPLRYARSFFGIVDLLAIIPTYLSLFLPHAQYLLIIRTLRVLRIFRVFKLAKYLGEAQFLMQALQASRRKIIVFLFVVLNIVVIVGALMYLIEGAEHGFHSIPHSVYWAIVTLTTVGYGDVAPETPIGQALAALLMITGYAIIAVPTGIVTAELALGVRQQNVSTQCCPACSAEGHDTDAVHCKHCGTAL
jgi:voltage-gated potassium channel